MELGVGHGHRPWKGLKLVSQSETGCYKLSSVAMILASHLATQPLLCVHHHCAAISLEGLTGDEWVLGVL